MVLLNSFVCAIAEDSLPKSRCSFPARYRTVDMVFCVVSDSRKMLSTKHRAVHIPCSSTSSKHLTQWTGLDLRGSAKSWAVPQFLNGCQLIQVRYSNYQTQPFSILNSVKQRFILAPLCSVFFGMVLRQTTKVKKDKNGVYIYFHTDAACLTISDNCMLTIRQQNNLSENNCGHYSYCSDKKCATVHHILLCKGLWTFGLSINLTNWYCKTATLYLSPSHFILDQNTVISCA